MAKLYAVYLAYHKSEVLPDEVAQDPNVPEYPASISRLRVYDNKRAQLECYANTMCPASMTLEADSQAELEAAVRDLEKKFEDPEWLKINVYPYI